MPVCKKCAASNGVKNGLVRQQQRWLCKQCGYNFIERDKRKDKRTPGLKAMATLLSCLGLSFRLVGRLLAVSHVTVQNWFDTFVIQLPSLDLGDVQVEEVEVDEMRTFLHSKKTNSGSTRQPPLLLAVLDSSAWKWVVVTLPR